MLINGVWRFVNQSPVLLFLCYCVFCWKMRLCCHSDLSWKKFVFCLFQFLVSIVEEQNVSILPKRAHKWLCPVPKGEKQNYYLDDSGVEVFHLMISCGDFCLHQRKKSEISLPYSQNSEKTRSKRTKNFLQLLDLKVFKTRKHLK